jgi:pimeloyl-ACP methyl ester carboxylesterase
MLRFDDYVDAIAKVVGTFDRPPILIGHSMGGLIAQHLAARSECAALVLLSSTPPWRPGGTRHTLPYLLSYALPVLAGRPLRATSRAARDLVLHDLTAAEQAALAPLFAFESGKAYRTVVFGKGRLDPRAVDCPVLCVNGGQDRLLGRSVGVRLARFYGAEHMVFAAQGHSLVADSLLATVAAPVRVWLARHGLERSPALPFAQARPYKARDQSLTTAA